MNKIANIYTKSFEQGADFLNYLSDKSITKNTTETTLQANQYYEAENQYGTMKSDGTKRVGFEFEFTNKILHGDYIELGVELRTVDGVSPVALYEEFEGAGTTKTPMFLVEDSSSFLYYSKKVFVTNRYGTSKCRVFVGLEVGQTGTFSFRFPVAKHHAQQKYSYLNEESKNKVFRISKSSGAWKVDASTSYRLLDKATLSVTINGLTLNLEKPFTIDIPHVFTSKNTQLGGFNVCFDYISKDSITLKLFNGDGTPKNWNDVPDGAVVNVFAKADVLY